MKPSARGPQPIDDPAFYDAHWRETSTADDPHIAAKATLMTSLVPADVRTIVDVGCGDGTLTHFFVERWQVTAVDRSAVALERLRCETVEASADALPMADRSADLLMSSEMLEHLPDPVFAGAIAEMQRVAGSYLLLSVPDREDVRRRFARCSKCDHRFNVYGHLRSLGAADLERLFGDFERVSLHTCGPSEAATFPRLEALRQGVARRWWMGADVALRCPACGATELKAPASGLAQRLVSRGIDHLTRWGNRLLGRAPRPYWLVLLLRRRGV